VELRLKTLEILKRYKYPPDQEATALELVLQRTKPISEEWVREDLGKNIQAAMADAISRNVKDLHVLFQSSKSSIPQSSTVTILDARSRHNADAALSSFLALTYCPSNTIARHLHHSAAGWCWEVQSVQVVGSTVVVIERLTIPTSDGDLLHYSAVASEPLGSRSQAPAAEVAASSCLRRAAALAGLGLELWG